MEERARARAARPRVGGRSRRALSGQRGFGAGSTGRPGQARAGPGTPGRRRRRGELGLEQLRCQAARCPGHPRLTDTPSKRHSAVDIDSKNRARACVQFSTAGRTGFSRADSLLILILILLFLYRYSGTSPRIPCGTLRSEKAVVE